MRTKILGLAYSVIGTVLTFTFIGYILDRVFNTGKTLMAIFMFLGFANAIAYYFYTVIKYARSQRD